MLKIIVVLLVILTTVVMAFFCLSAIWLNAHREPVSVPEIVIIGQIQEVTFHERTVWYIDYMIEGYKQDVTLYHEEDIPLFIKKLESVGNVTFVRE